MSDIAPIIHAHRRKSGLTQNQLARIAGVGKTVVFDIEHGKLTVQLDTLLKILTVLNIKLVLETPLKLTQDNQHAQS